MTGLALLGLCTPTAWAQPKLISSKLLFAGQSLYVGQMLVSQNGNFQLVVQTDGDLVLYQVSPHIAVWSSQTVGQRSYELSMQTDGNVVLYDDATPPHALWSSQTSGYRGAYPFGAYLLLQDDGNLVVSTEIPCWSPEPGPLCP